MLSEEMMEQCTNFEWIGKILEGADLATICVVIATMLITIFTVKASASHHLAIEKNKKVSELRDAFAYYLAIATQLEALFSTSDNELRVQSLRSSKDQKIDGMLSVYEKVDQGLLSLESSKIKLQLLLIECNIQNEDLDVKIDDLHRAIKSKDELLDVKIGNLLSSFKRIIEKRT
jgi:hypothetical protein